MLNMLSSHANHGEDGHRLRIGRVAAVLGRDEALHAGLDGGVNKLALLAIDLKASGHDDGILAGKRTLQLLGRVAVVDLDDADTIGVGARRRRLARHDRHGEFGVRL